jgi:transposase
LRYYKNFQIFDFLFRSAGAIRWKGDKLKALYYETNSFTLWYRRLEKGKFVFPKNQERQITMSTEHFYWLLASDKFSKLEVLNAKLENFI